jgi:DNA polymerase elongation subunit (family B)
MSAYHGRTLVYPFNETDLPKEADFLNPVDIETENAEINARQPIYFTGSDVREKTLENAGGQWNYQIVVYGKMKSGRSAVVLVDGIYPRFEVRCLKGDTDGIKTTRLVQDVIGADPSTAPISYKIIHARRLRGYETKNSVPYLRMMFTRANIRLKALSRLRASGWDMCDTDPIFHASRQNLKQGCKPPFDRYTSDDGRGKYHLLVAREHDIKWCAWAQFTRYTEITSGVLKDKFMSRRVFRVQIEDYKAAPPSKQKWFQKPGYKVSVWDIEASTAHHRLPEPMNPSDRAFMISYTYGSQWDKTPMLNVCFVDVPCNPHPNYFTIVCGCEKNVLYLFSKLFSRMKPDFMFGYNDSDFDWPWVLVRINQHGLLGDFLKNLSGCTLDKLECAGTPFEKWYENLAKRQVRFALKEKKVSKKAKKPSDTMAMDIDIDESIGDTKLTVELHKGRQERRLQIAYLSDMVSSFGERPIGSSHIKIDAQTYADGYAPDVDGCVFADILTICRKLNPNAEKKTLNFFLNKNNLGSKNDMSIHDLFTFYRASFLHSHASMFNEFNKDLTYDEYHKPQDMEFAHLTERTFTPEQILENMKTVADYCVMDSVKCHQLLHKLVIIADNQIKANKFNVTIANAFFNADGMKVRNLIFKEASKLNILCSNSSVEVDKDRIKYEGALVYEPVVGLKKTKLTLRERILRCLSYYNQYMKRAEDRSVDDLVEYTGLRTEPHPAVRKMGFGVSTLMARAMEIAIGEAQSNAVLVEDELVRTKIIDRAFELYCVFIICLSKGHTTLTDQVETPESKGVDVVDVLAALTPEYLPEPTAARGSDIVILKKFPSSECVARDENTSIDACSALMRGYLHDWLLEANEYGHFGLDYSSLYPNIICTMNISPELCASLHETCVPNALDIAQQYSELTQQIYKMQQDEIASITPEERAMGWTGYAFWKEPGTTIPETNYPLGLQFKFADKEIVSSFAWHGGKNIDVNKPHCKMGIYPTILNKEFNERKRIKVPFAWTKTLIEHVNATNAQSDRHNSLIDAYEFHKADIALNRNLIALYSLDARFKNLRFEKYPISMLPRVEIDRILATYDPKSDADLYDAVEQGTRRAILANPTCLDNFMISLSYLDISYVLEILPTLVRVPTTTVISAREGYEIILEDVLKAKVMDMKCDNDMVAAKLHELHELVKAGHADYKHLSFEAVRDRVELSDEEWSMDEIQFVSNRFNSLQGAAKITMNTFYGEAGNTRSSTYMLSIAGSVTAFGRFILKFSENITTSVLKCIRYYGDTDSLYLMPHSSKYQDLDMLYFSGQIDKQTYLLQVVNRTFTLANDVVKHINKCLFDRVRCNFMGMAYEEVCCPIFYISKKKYVCIKHEGIANFATNRADKDMYLERGLDTRKRGVAEAAKDAVRYVRNKLLDFNCIDEPLEIVYAVIDKFYADAKAGKFTYKDFAKTAVYKPMTRDEILDGKGNKPVLQFVERLRAAGNALKPQERFAYVVIARYPWEYKNGQKIKPGMGHFWELVEDAEAQKLPIDLDYYMENSIIGQLARLIIYRPEFYVQQKDDSDRAINDANKMMYEKAKVHLKEYTARYRKKYVDLKPLYGGIRKKIDTDIVLPAFGGDRVRSAHYSKEWDNIEFNPWFNNKFDEIHKRIKNECMMRSIDRAKGCYSNYDSWEEGYHALKAFVEVQNRMPAWTSSDEVLLCIWVVQSCIIKEKIDTKKFRKSKATDNLTKDVWIARIYHMEHLPHFAWITPRDVPVGGTVEAVLKHLYLKPGVKYEEDKRQYQAVIKQARELLSKIYPLLKDFHIHKDTVINEYYNKICDTFHLNTYGREAITGAKEPEKVISVDEIWSKIPYENRAELTYKLSEYLHTKGIDKYDTYELQCWRMVEHWIKIHCTNELLRDQLYKDTVGKDAVTADVLASFAQGHEHVEINL